MKKTKGLLTAVVVGNTILTILAFITLAIGCLITFWGIEVIVKDGSLLAEGTAEAEGVLQGVLDVINPAAGGVLAAALGIIMVAGGFIYFILHLIPMIISLSAKSVAKKYMESDAERCRKKIKKAAVISIVFNAVTVAFSFILTLGEMAFLLIWMFVYVVLVFTIIVSISLVVSTSEDSFYIVEDSNMAFSKPVQPVLASREDNEWGGVAPTYYVSEHSVETAQKMAEKAAAKAAKAEAEAKAMAEQARIEAEAAKAEAEAAKAEAEKAKEDVAKAEAENEALKAEVELLKANETQKKVTDEEN